jgi:hypothetical protein
MFTGAGLGDTDFGVLPTTPMDDHDDLSRGVVDIDHDVVDQRAQQLLACPGRHAWRLPGDSKIL